MSHLEARNFGRIVLLQTLIAASLTACGFKDLKEVPGQAAGRASQVALIEPKFDPAAPAATYQEVDAKIIEPKCVRCHHSGDKLDFEDYAGFATDPKLIVPGQPEKSELFTEVHTGKMPKKGPALAPEEVGMIYTWILNGAKQDAPADQAL